ncbi:hypothetical protein B0H19DRAFT_1077023 [Mycena capillaripes]|nr:hypothetical protein B0H19DRAFT_1077023 [Mycena capillaripes]
MDAAGCCAGCLMRVRPLRPAFAYARSTLAVAASWKDVQMPQRRDRPVVPAAAGAGYPLPERTVRKPQNACSGAAGGSCTAEARQRWSCGSQNVAARGAAGQRVQHENCYRTCLISPMSITTQVCGLIDAEMRLASRDRIWELPNWYLMSAHPEGHGKQCHPRSTPSSTTSSLLMAMPEIMGTCRPKAEAALK